MYWPLLNVVIIEYQLAAIITWRIPGTGEPGGLLSLGSHRVGHDWSDLAAAAIITMLLNSVVTFLSSSYLSIYTLFLIRQTLSTLGSVTSLFSLFSICVLTSPLPNSWSFLFYIYSFCEEPHEIAWFWHHMYAENSHNYISCIGIFPNHPRPIPPSVCLTHPYRYWHRHLTLKICHTESLDSNSPILPYLSKWSNHVIPRLILDFSFQQSTTLPSIHQAPVALGPTISKIYYLHHYHYPLKPSNHYLLRELMQ